MVLRMAFKNVGNLSRLEVNKYISKILILVNLAKIVRLLSLYLFGKARHTVGVRTVELLR